MNDAMIGRPTENVCNGVAALEGRWYSRGRGVDVRKPLHPNAARPARQARGAENAKPWSFLHDSTFGGFLGRPPPWADFTRASSPRESGRAARADLRIGRPDRSSEAEADRVADRVAAGDSGGKAQAGATPSRPLAGDAPAGGGLASRIGSLAAGGGESVPPAVLAASREALGRSLDGVRLHRGSGVAPIARELGARAFTLGNDVFVRGEDYAPATQAGRRLLAHELAHVAQQGGERRLIQRQTVGPAPSGGAPVTAASLIDQHTSLADLEEAALGRDLAMRALRGEHEIVHQVMNELGSRNRDDVAVAFMEALQLGQVRALEATPGGRHVLDRLLDELTSGSVGKDEQDQADKIVVLKNERIGPAKLGEAALSPGVKVFPLRLGGPTVLNPAPIFATLRSRGLVHVKIPVAVLGTKEFADEVRTLPSKVATSGLDIPADEIVGVRLYDFHGKVQFMPAIQLVELSNRQTRETVQKVVEVAAIAATLGSGALIGAGARGATLTARVLLAADRVATALGIITLVIQDHRGWIRQQFGEKGEQFLRAVDVVQSVVAVFGLVRLVSQAPRVFRAFRDAYRRWREAADAIKGGLDRERGAAVQKIIDETDKLLKEADEVEAAAKPPGGGGAAAPPGAAPGAPAARAAAEPAAPQPAATAPAPAKAPPAPKKPRAEPAPATETRAAGAPTKAEKQLVTRPVPGLFKGVKTDPVQGPWRFQTTTTERALANGGRTTMVTTNVSLQAPNGLTYNGLVIRSVTVTPKPGGGHDVKLIMDMAFLDDIPRELRWVREGGAPLVTGQGTPLQTYVSLLQLKSAGISFGEITQAKMSNIINAQTVLQLEVLRRKNPSAAVDKLIEQTQSGIYGSTNLTQAGSTVRGMKVKGGGPKNVGELADEAGMTKKELEAFGLSRDDTARRYGFDIEIEIAPPSGGTP
jgi:hypothetical protein